MPNYSNIKGKVKNAKEGKSEDYEPMIPDGEESAIHILRFVSGEIAESKGGNIQAVLKCKVIKRGSKLNNKEEKLFFLLEHPKCPWQLDQFLAIMDGLGLDFAARVPENMEHDGWKDIFDDMDDFEGKIDFEVEYKYQYEKAGGEKKKGFDKRVTFDKIKAISWPKAEESGDDDGGEGDDQDDQP